MRVDTFNTDRSGGRWSMVETGNDWFSARYGANARVLAEDGKDGAIGLAPPSLLAMRAAYVRRGLGFVDGDTFDIEVGWDPNAQRLQWRGDGPAAGRIENVEEGRFLNGVHLPVRFDDEEGVLENALVHRTTWRSDREGSTASAEGSAGPLGRLIIGSVRPAATWRALLAGYALPGSKSREIGTLGDFEIALQPHSEGPEPISLVTLHSREAKEPPDVALCLQDLQYVVGFPVGRILDVFGYWPDDGSGSLVIEGHGQRPLGRRRIFEPRYDVAFFGRALLAYAAMDEDSRTLIRRMIDTLAMPMLLDVSIPAHATILEELAGDVVEDRYYPADQRAVEALRDHIVAHAGALIPDVDERARWLENIAFRVKELFRRTAAEVDARLLQSFQLDPEGLAGFRGVRNRLTHPGGKRPDVVDATEADLKGRWAVACLVCRQLNYDGPIVDPREPRESYDLSSAS